MRCICGMWFVVAAIVASDVALAEDVVIGTRTLRVPDGYEVELAADPALVERPIAVGSR